MKIEKWIAKHKLTHRQAAELLGVPRDTLRSWIYNGKAPLTPTAARVEHLTDGAVKLRDWFPEAYDNGQ